jgi:hypothetical protein
MPPLQVLASAVCPEPRSGDRKIQVMMNQQAEFNAGRG